MEVALNSIAEGNTQGQERRIVDIQACLRPLNHQRGIIGRKRHGGLESYLDLGTQGVMKAEALGTQIALSEQGVHLLAIQVPFCKQGLSQFVKARFVSDPVRQPLGVGVQVAQVDVASQKDLSSSKARSSPSWKPGPKSAASIRIVVSSEQSHAANLGLLYMPTHSIFYVTYTFSGVLPLSFNCYVVLGT